MRHLSILLLILTTGAVFAEEELVKVWLQSEPAGAEVFLVLAPPPGVAAPELKSLGHTPGLFKFPEGRPKVMLKLAKYKDTSTDLAVAGKTILKPEPIKLELVTYPLDVDLG